MKEQKWTVKILKLFAACAMLIFLFGANAMAAGTKVVTMAPNKGAYTYKGMWEDSSTTVYHRIDAKKSGIIVIGGLEYSLGIPSNLSVTLCDAGKRAVSSVKSVGSEKNSYAVLGINKGTYYIKTSNVKYYMLVASMSNFADKGGASKKKAVNIKQNKMISGVLPVGEKAKKADWFKIKIKKSKILQIDIQSYGYGVKYYVYGPSYPKGSYMGMLSNQKARFTSKNLLTGKKAKVKPGVYYLKVIRDSKDSSGAYQVKWK